MDIKKSGNKGVPLYLQIQEIIKSKIVIGEFSAGDQIPTEKDFSKLYHVSNITARQAILNLVEEGFLIRIPGKGTFVTDLINEIKTTKFSGSMRDLIQDALKASEVVVLDIEEIKAPTKIAEYLKLERNSPIIKTRRKRISGGVPVSYIVNYLLLEVGRKITKKDLVKFPMLKILQEFLGITIRSGNQSIEAILADYDVASALSINMFSPLLYLETTIFGPKKKPVEFTQMYLKPERYKFDLKLKIGKNKDKTIDISIDRK
jgi:GntR family transcriptional regulator